MINVATNSVRRTTRVNETRRTNANRKNSYYIDGNTVRKLDVYTSPQRKRRPEQEVRRPQAEQEKTEVRHEKRVGALDLRYTLFLFVSVAVIMASCFTYLNMRTELTHIRKEVAVLEEQLEYVQTQNSSLLEAMNQPVDLNAIYMTATQELGMIPADESQIVYYDSSNNDYIHQYSQIPN